MTQIERTVAGRFSTHEPIYFIYGPDAPGAKFQFSFKYRLLSDSGILGSGVPTLRGLHLAYTQRSLWTFGQVEPVLRHQLYAGAHRGMADGENLNPDGAMAGAPIVDPTRVQRPRWPHIAQCQHRLLPSGCDRRRHQRMESDPVAEDLRVHGRLERQSGYR